MALSNEDKLEIEKIIRETLPDALERERIKRMERSAALPPDPAPERETKTYLVTFAGHHIAFPSEHGSVVHHQSIYARVTREKRKWSDQWAIGEALVIAYGDGRLLETPYPMLMLGFMSAMVEIDEAAILGNKAMTAGGS